MPYGTTDIWDLIHRKLLYYRQTNLTLEEFKTQFKDIMDLTTDTVTTNPDVMEYIPNLINETEGRYYKLIKRCADKLYQNGGAGINREKLVTMQTTRSENLTGSIASLTYDGVTNGTLYDYINYWGAGHHCKISFDYNSNAGSTPQNISRRVKFYNFEIYFGAGITSHDLILKYFKFYNCKLFFYRNAVLENVITDNSTILMATGKDLNYVSSGGETSVVKNSVFNKNINEDAATQLIGGQDYNYVETMPTDPTI